MSGDRPPRADHSVADDGRPDVTADGTADASADVGADVGADGGADERAGVLRIDCDECDHQHSTICRDCLVTFLCERDEGSAVIIPLGEVRTVRMLQQAGLAPDVRHRQTRAWRATMEA